MEWLLELAPHFYVDRRKQLIAEQHKKETIRNLEHEVNKKKPEMLASEHSITGMIAK